MMPSDGSVRSHRRRSFHVQNYPPNKESSSKTPLNIILLSCCLFFFISTVCLFTALVFIGKHFYYNDVQLPVVLPNTNNSRDEDLSGGGNETALLRLDPEIRPLHYDLLMDPDLDTGEFGGSAKITFRLRDNDELGSNITKSNLLVHVKHLNIDSLRVHEHDNANVELVHDFSENVTDETLSITFKDGYVLSNENLYVLNVNYHGSLRDKLVGFYKSVYFDRDSNETRSIATTKFEPTYARQAFPCFDEPNMKANFTIRVVKPKDDSYIALSNMPEKTSEPFGDDKVLVTFEESVKMPTYLACFVVCDFKSTADVIASKFGNIPYRVFATPAQLDKTEYATYVGKKVMEYYLQYFNIAYPLPKLDMVAIPDYSSGATEHWGIVTFRETALLFDKNISSSANRKRVAMVVAHELAHSWFGNLVTMDWWNDLWLNEGFASYIEYKGVDSVHPEWKMLDQFAIEDLHRVLELDATLASHPIVQTVTTPDQITEIFDTISYSKGASILRMLEHSIGEETFQQGVTNYLNKYSFGNAVTQDLLDELQILVHATLNLTDYMNTWIVQMGYPIVNVSRTEQGFRLTQRRFLKDPTKTDSTISAYNYKWTIPITYITADDKTPKLIWFNHTEEFVDLKIHSDFVKFNAKQVGYYRVNYEESEWATLTNHIYSLEVPDRAHLLEESFRIAESTLLNYQVPLNLSKYLTKELDYVPWTVASTMLKQLKSYIRTSTMLPNFKNYVIDLVTPAYENYTWSENEDDSHLTRLARSTVIGLACSMGHEKCLKEAKQKFQSWLYYGEKLSPDLKGLVYSYGMKHGNNEDWDKLWNKYVDESDAGEKNYLLQGLASVEDASLLHRLIELAKDDTYIRKQDYFTCLSYISNNPAGTNIVWDYIRENWLDLVARFGLNDRYLGGLIPTVSKDFASNIRKEEMLTFYVKHPEAGAGAAARARALENIDNNINWLSRNKDSVEEWLKLQ